MLGSAVSRARSRQACVLCHQLKLKCDLEADCHGSCTRCKDNGKTCEKRDRKAYAKRKSTASRMAGSSIEPRQSSAVASGRDSGRDESADFTVDADMDDPEETDEDGYDLIAHAVTDPQAISTNTRAMPIYAGDGQGIGAILDVALSTRPGMAKSSRSANYLMVAQSVPRALQPEDLEYLKIKGCFSLPSLEICERLLQRYFQFLHPTFQIIDARAFTDAYSDGGISQINLLLLWSMFSVSASFVDDETLKQSGYSTRSGWKEVMVRRAKLLFDISQESDKVVLIQSALLLGFWFKDAEDVMQSWHWTGIAIGIAQTLGLHKDPDAKTRKNPNINDSQRRLWRQLWWACVMRDAWLAFGMGRPMRIQLSACDCPKPRHIDVVKSMDVVETAFSSRLLYRYEDINKLASLWSGLLDVSYVLRKTLQFRNGRNKAPCFEDQAVPLLNVIHDIEEAIHKDSGGKTVPVVGVARIHVRLCCQAAAIALWRHSAKFPADAIEAATATSDVLHDVMGNGEAGYASPMTISLIVPAMHTYLCAIREQSEQVQYHRVSQAARYKLQLCLTFLKTVEENYPAAAIIHRMFTAALNPRRYDTSQAVNHGEGSASDAVHESQQYPGPASTPISWLTPASDGIDLEVSPMEYQIWSAQVQAFNEYNGEVPEFTEMLNFGCGGMSFDASSL